MPPVLVFRSSRFASLLEGASILAVALAIPVVAVRGQWRPADPMQPAALVYAPWTSAADAAARATSGGASLIGFGAFSFIVVVRPDDPSFVQRALARGAWMALDPLSAPMCAPRPAAQGASP